MASLSHLSAVCLDPDIYKALRLKAAEENRTISDIVNEALRAAALEDAEDISDLDERKAEASLGYADFVKSLKDNGVL